MTSGTIHPVGSGLFVIEGHATERSAAVYWNSGRLFLLGTGSGPAQRAAVRTVAASYGTVDELILVTAGRPSPAENNDDLLGVLAAGRRRRLTARAPAGRSRQPPTQTEPNATSGNPGFVRLGGHSCPGWHLSPQGPTVVRLGPEHHGEFAYYVGTCGALLVPEHVMSYDVKLTDARLHRARFALLDLLTPPTVTVVALGPGPPIRPAAARAMLQDRH